MIYLRDRKAKETTTTKKKRATTNESLLYIVHNQLTTSAFDVEFPSMYLQTWNKDFKVFSEFQKIFTGLTWCLSYNVQNKSRTQAYKSTSSFFLKRSMST